MTDQPARRGPHRRTVIDDRDEPRFTSRRPVVFARSHCRGSRHGANVPMGAPARKLSLGTGATLSFGTVGLLLGGVRRSCPSRADKPAAFSMPIGVKAASGYRRRTLLCAVGAIRQHVMNRNPPTATSPSSGPGGGRLGCAGLVTLMCFQLSAEPHHHGLRLLDPGRPALAHGQLHAGACGLRRRPRVPELLLYGAAFRFPAGLWAGSPGVRRLPGRGVGRHRPRYSGRAERRRPLSARSMRSGRSGTSFDSPSIRIPALVASKLPDGAGGVLESTFRGPHRPFAGGKDSDGAGWRHFIPTTEPSTNGALRPRDRRAFREGSRLRRADGEYRWFVFRLVPLRDEQGRVLKWYANRERHRGPQAEPTAVLRSQARLLDLTHDTVFVRDHARTSSPIGIAARSKPTAGRPITAIGKVTHELLHTTFPEPLADITEKLLRTDRVGGRTGSHQRDWTQVTVASRWALQRDEQGNAIAILETNNDVHRAQASRGSAAAPGGPAGADPRRDHRAGLSGTICFWNRGAQQLYGYSKTRRSAVSRTTSSNGASDAHRGVRRR